MQDLWSLGHGWDDVLPEKVRKKWVENLKIMKHLLTLQFDRKLKPSDAIGPPQIHGFSDAGEQAYGAVIFLCWELKDGSFYCVPVVIKPFVALHPVLTQLMASLKELNWINSKHG